MSHSIKFKKENKKTQVLILPPKNILESLGMLVHKAPQVILIMKPVTNALGHGNTCQDEAMYIWKWNVATTEIQCV